MSSAERASSRRTSMVSRPAMTAKASRTRARTIFRASFMERAPGSATSARAPTTVRTPAGFRNGRLRARARGDRCSVARAVHLRLLGLRGLGGLLGGLLRRGGGRRLRGGRGLLGGREGANGQQGHGHTEQQGRTLHGHCLLRESREVRLPRPFLEATRGPMNTLLDGGEGAGRSEPVGWGRNAPRGAGCPEVLPSRPLVERGGALARAMLKRLR